MQLANEAMDLIEDLHGESDPNTIRRLKRQLDDKVEALTQVAVRDLSGRGRNLALKLACALQDFADQIADEIL